MASSEFGESDWFKTVGNWAINRWAHPDGFKPIADAAHAAGLKFLLRYEIEIHRGGTKQMSGAELQKYLLEMPQPRTMHLVFYKKI